MVQSGGVTHQPPPLQGWPKAAPPPVLTFYENMLEWTCSGRSQLHLGCYRRISARKPRFSPALPPDTACELLTPAQTGATAADRIALVRAELEKAGATALAVTGLDCVGWLLNLRAAQRTCPVPPPAVAVGLADQHARTCPVPVTLVTMEPAPVFFAPAA